MMGEKEKKKAEIEKIKEKLFSNLLAEFNLEKQKIRKDKKLEKEISDPVRKSFEKTWDEKETKELKLYKSKLKELEEERKNGVLTEEQYNQKKAESNRDYYKKKEELSLEKAEPWKKELKKIEEKVKQEKLEKIKRIGIAYERNRKKIEEEFEDELRWIELIETGQGTIQPVIPLAITWRPHRHRNTTTSPFLFFFIISTLIVIFNCLTIRKKSRKNY